MSINVIARGDHRLEAETYLSEGFGIRSAIQSQSSGWVPLETKAAISQPPRTKATLVSREFGTPFLIASQMFEFRPIIRKWLAIEQLAHSDELFAKRGDILVRRSGDVGRSVTAFGPHLGALISDHFFRVEPREERFRGWLYAYLRSPKVRAMMSGAKYGHIIKHLEVGHLAAVPIPNVSEHWLAHFAAKTREVLDLRDQAYKASLDAEAHFESCVGTLKVGDGGESGFEVKASEAFFKPRRRLDAANHNPRATAILRHFVDKGLHTKPLGEITERVWWMTRFKRVYGEEGVRYLSADELFDLNPLVTKRILIGQADNTDAFFAKAGWLIMACSGQTYGLLGSIRLMTKYEEDAFLSHDLIRIAPRAGGVSPGYLLTALSHPVFGRPLVLRYAYGTSIPHLDPSDIAACPVVRLASADEKRIAHLVERSAELRSQADALENQLAAEADEILGRFIAGDTRDLAEA